MCLRLVSPWKRVRTRISEQFQELGHEVIVAQFVLYGSGATARLLQVKERFWSAGSARLALLFYLWLQR
jgi:hypothetical protein